MIQMALDLILRNARLASTGQEHPLIDIGVQHGRIVAVEPHLAAEGPAHDAGGKLVSPGLIESHFHLDKTRLIDRVPLQPNRMVRDHMERTAAVKHTFTPEDLFRDDHGAGGAGDATWRLRDRRRERRGPGSVA